MASLSNINGLFDVHSTGAILFSTSHGTSGQILRSNGNAAPTWVAASTVIGGPYLPLTGGTLSGPLSGTSATFSGKATFSDKIQIGSFISNDYAFTLKAASVATLPLAVFEDTASANGNGIVVNSVNTPNNYIADFKIGNVSKVKINKDGGIDVAGNQIKIDPASGDAILQLQSSTQTLRVDQNSIRTGTNNNLALFTNGNSNQLVLKQSNGFVGIGNINPGAKLVVGSGIHSSSTGIDVAAGAGGGNVIALDSADNHNWFPYTNGDNYYSANNHLFRSGTGNSPYYMTINTSGNVGIGLGSGFASKKLEVAGSYKLGTNAYIQYDAGYPYTISILNTAGVGNLIFNAGAGSSGFESKIELQGSNTTGAAGITLSTGSSPRMVVTADGRVGIGTTNPQAKLHVNGGAIISGTRFGDNATASINTTGIVIANVPNSSNGQSVLVEFVASGGGGAYYNVVYACYNGAGVWYYTKNVVGSGGNIEVAETNGSGSSTLVFYFRATSSQAAYTPRVMMKGTPYGLVTF